MDDVALGANGDLAFARGRDRGVLLDAQDDFGVERVYVHDLHGVADFFLGVLTQCIGYVHFASGYGDAHGGTSLIVGEQKQPGGNIAYGGRRVRCFCRLRIASHPSQAGGNRIAQNACLRYQKMKSFSKYCLPTWLELTNANGSDVY